MADSLQNRAPSAAPNGVGPPETKIDGVSGACSPPGAAGLESGGRGGALGVEASNR